ncbi:MAG: UDP-N-acetylmuramoyl-tripeptide--D-alanyl-D-alanine ligase [Rhodobacteraceae bacterium]|nr:UDP-N-acetylmuramoyl-tripeptide--D-alanyl-D-alanine ligase [Paracoccaceae bacterium]
MSVLWTSEEAVAATGGTSAVAWRASGVSIDTRTVEPGDLFVALKDQRDGHDFVADALDKGAAAALVSRVPEGVSADAPLLLVGDVLSALEDMGRAARARTRAKVIGVTGSVGKTGTKEMLRKALEAQGRVHAAERSFNNHWGVPLTLARMPTDTDFAVIEIGMNHPGEIGPLAKMADLDVAVVTTVAAVHMAAFSSVEEIAAAKAEIFEGLRSGGTAVLNADVPTRDILFGAAELAGAGVVAFGTDESAQMHLVSAQIVGETTTIEAEFDGQPILFKLGAPGRHLAMNALAVLAAAEAAGADLARAMLALQHWHAPDGRGARYLVDLANGNGKTLELIDESYNANPTSMKAALAVLAAAEPVDNVGRILKGRRIAFLGDMLELGPQELPLHADLADMAALGSIDMVHTSGARMRALHEVLPVQKQGEWFENADQMARTVHSLLDAGDVAMVKGSLGSQVGKVVKAIKALGEPAEKQGQ